MAEISRRRLLTSGAAVAGAAAVSSALPPNLRRALAAPPRQGSFADIKHVVILMQENRSFDHYFGTLSGVRGFDDPKAIKLPNGNSVFQQPDPKNPAGYLLPFHLDTRTTSSQGIPSTGHGWGVQHEAWNNGKMDNWLPAHRKSDGDDVAPYTMGYYDRHDIPFQFALAESFTICDAYHCSLLGPTWPNRLYHWTGTIDPRGTGGGPITSNVVKKPYTWTTYPERLTKAGVSWHVYQQEDDYGCNPLKLFKNYQDAGPSSPLYQHALTIGPADQFEEDARNDRLPTVSWIIPTAAQCEHPDYTPASGADFVANKLDAIAANPEVWNKTLFILNYDENDGLFDHVPPPTPPPGTVDEFVKGVPIGAGVRVPCFLVSPWTQGGWVATENFDHTSVLRFLERLTGVAEPNISAWRRRTFGDLTSAIGASSHRPFPHLPPTKAQLWRSEHEVATLPPATIPGRNQKPPHQEHGRPRPHRDPKPHPSAAPAALSSTRQTMSRVTESLTTHAADFPDGYEGTSFPGIAVAATMNTTPKTANKHLYVATISGYQIVVIDAMTHQIVRGVKAGNNPYGIAATPDGKKIFVANSGASDVSVFDPATDKITGQITVGLYPHGIVVTPDGRHAYVANTGPDTGNGGSRSLSVIDTSRQKVTRTLITGLAPHSLVLSPDGRSLYVSCHDGLYVTDTLLGLTRAVVRTVTRANGLAVSPDGRFVYAANPWQNAVSVVDTRTHKLVSRIPTGRTPWNVAFRSDGAFAYVSNSNEDTVAVIDVAKRAVVKRIVVGHVPTGVRATDDTLWVSNNGSATMTAISLADLTVTGTVELALGVQPSGITAI